MTDRADIVTRLRDWASTICMVRGDEAPGSKARLALEAAELIETLRKVNAEVFATGIKSTRDTAELAIELREARAERDKMARQLDEYRESFASMARERDGLWDDLELVTRERDEARCEVCAHEADTTEDQQAYAKLRGWQCFAHTDGASSSGITDNCPSQERVRVSYENGGAP